MSKSSLASDLRGASSAAEIYQLLNTYHVEVSEGVIAELLSLLFENREGLKSFSAWKSFVLGFDALSRREKAHILMTLANHFCLEDEFVRWESASLNSIGVRKVESPVLSAERREFKGCPEVSVLCTTYNHQFFIESAITSILAQNVDFKIEIIIGDDSSTDSTHERLIGIVKRYGGIVKIVRYKHNIVSSKRTPFDHLMRLASGKYLAFCDGDDFWIDRNKLQRHVACLEKNLSLIGTSHNMILWDTVSGRTSPAHSMNFCRVSSPKSLKKVSNMVWTNTLVCRNLGRGFEPEAFLCRARDSFLTSMLGAHGWIYGFDAHVSAVQRRTLSSFWLPRPESYKNIERLRLRYAIAAYLRRLGDFDLLDYCDWRIDKLKINPNKKLKILKALSIELSEIEGNPFDINSEEFELIGFD